MVLRGGITNVTSTSLSERSFKLFHLRDPAWRMLNNQLKLRLVDCLPPAVPTGDLH